MACVQLRGQLSKVIVHRDEVREFRSRFPCSGLRDRSYWFEFDTVDHDLVDTDVPQQDDGSGAQAMSEACKILALDGISADWMRD